MARNHYTKNDVKRHSSGYGYGPKHPAVNVKVYGPCFVEKCAEHFVCSVEIAEKALGFAWDSACEAFWEYWQDQTGDLENGLYGSLEYAYFPGYTVEVFAEGRSAGWLEVHGLPPVEDWD